MREIAENEHTVNGQEQQTSMIIVDSKRVKNTDTAEQKGFDAGEKTSGVKLHIGVDAFGLSHAMFASRLM